jgi:hypothetical protein
MQVLNKLCADDWLRQYSSSSSPLYSRGNKINESSPMGVAVVSSLGLRSIGDDLNLEPEELVEGRLVAEVAGSRGVRSAFGLFVPFLKISDLRSRSMRK